MSKIVGIGACVADTLILLPTYPTEDTKMKADSVKQVGGGPVATGLTAASRLGASCAYLGVLSEDATGNFLQADFQKYGVDTSLVQTYAGHRSFTSCIWLSAEGGSRTCAFDRGDLPGLKLGEAEKAAIREAEILMVDGNDMAAAIEAATYAHTVGTKVLYDAGGLYAGVENLLPHADILIPSEEFALGHTGTTEAAEAAKVLYERYHPEVVVITCGKRGGILYDGESVKAYPIYPAEVVDSNGAGDVFHGAYAAGRTFGYTYEQCCHYASAVSALKCTGVGARESVPEQGTVLEYLKENGYEL